MCVCHDYNVILCEYGTKEITAAPPGAWCGCSVRPLAQNADRTGSAEDGTGRDGALRPACARARVGFLGRNPAEGWEPQSASDAPLQRAFKYRTI